MLPILIAAVLSACGQTQPLHVWDFETGLQGWTKWSNREMQQEVVEGNAHSGGFALRGRVEGRAALVHCIDGLRIPMGATLRLWYFVPESSDFDHFTLNLRTHEHGEQGNPPFQVSVGLRKGSWRRIELPFRDFFGWSDRAFGSWTIRQFEIAATGVGEVLLDDVEVIASDRPAPAVPSVLWLPDQDVTQAPGGARAHFRRTFELPRLPRYAWLQAGGDNEGTAWINGVQLGTAPLGSPAECDLTPHLRVGANVVALSVLNHGEQPNPSGGLSVIGWGDARPDEHLLVSDATWRASATAPDGWTQIGFDDSTWTPAATPFKVPGGPWGVPDVYPLRSPLNRRVPEVAFEVEGRALFARFTPQTPLAKPLHYTASVGRTAANLTVSDPRTVQGEVAAGSEPRRAKLSALEGLDGALTAEVRFPAEGETVSKVLWLPPKAPSQLGRATTHRAKATGFFHTEKVGERWWLVDPEGNLFFSVACNAVMHERGWSFHYDHHVAQHYADETAWREFSAERLLGWGLNSSNGSPESDACAQRGMPYFAGFNLLWAGPWLQRSNGERIMFPDVFDPEWRRGAEARVREVTDRHRDDPLLIGYWTDNEITMHDPLSPSQGVMEAFWSPGCQAELLRWLSERYADDVAALNRQWSSPLHTYAYAAFEDVPTDKPTIRDATDPVAPDLQAFVRHIVKTYAETYVGLWKQHDPNHLVCTNRFAGQFDLAFADLLRPYDLIACNSYPRSHWGQTDFDAEQLAWLRGMHEATGKPVIVSEWGTQAADSHLINVWGRLDTQQQRGECYERVLEQLWDEGYIVGTHWFGWGDSTDGERANWGLLDALDRPYTDVTSAMTRAHARLQERVRSWQP